MPSSVTRLAIIKFGALGDVVRTTSLLRPLHRKYGPCEIWWYTSSSAAPLLEGNPWISRILTADRRPDPDAPDSFDWVLGLDEEPAALALASRLPARQRFGAYLDDHGRPAYTPSSRAWFDMSLLNRDRDGKLTTANALKRANQKTHAVLFCEMLEAPPDARHPAEPILVPDAEAEAWARVLKAQRQLDAASVVVGLNTGSGSRWPNKQLSIPKTLELIRALARVPGAAILLLGGPEEKERNETLRRRSPAPLVDAATPGSVKRLLSATNLCDVLITSDSLALHVATALSKQVVAFLGPTSVSEIDLYGRGMFWTPAEGCSCFYLTACRAPTFCLDLLDVHPVVEFASRWAADRTAAAARRRREPGS